MPDPYFDLLSKQKKFFSTGKTLDLGFREKQLKQLYRVIKDNENKLAKALFEDLHKSPFESYIAETGFTLSEISFLLKNFKKWAQVQRKKTPLVLFKANSAVFPEPYGQCLIFSAWNYPVQLIFAPLAGAIAAGNTAVLKPSEFAVATKKLITQLISDYFDPEYICVVNGGAETGKKLMENDFDYVFFTGSPAVGKIVYKQAAAGMIPVTLELGGKNPCIIDETANLDLTARKIIWGKFLNAGQTCIAPDYLLVQEKVMDQLITKLIQYIENYFGKNIMDSPDYCRIINEKNVNRLEKLLENQPVVYGGEIKKEEMYVQPTLILNPSFDSSIMQEEIFGPLLPVIPFDSINSALNYTRKGGTALAFYVFSGSRVNQNFLIRNVKAGSAAINDTLMQIANPQLPFGGINSSGIGKYHGKYSFETFSHFKAVMKKSTWFDNKLIYPPYKPSSMNILKKFLN